MFFLVLLTDSHEESLTRKDPLNGCVGKTGGSRHHHRSETESSEVSFPHTACGWDNYAASCWLELRQALSPIDHGNLFGAWVKVLIAGPFCGTMVVNVKQIIPVARTCNSEGWECFSQVRSVFLGLIGYQFTRIPGCVPPKNPPLQHLQLWKAIWFHSTQRVMEITLG